MAEPKTPKGRGASARGKAKPAAKDLSIAEYRAKRDFHKTPEPSPDIPATPGRNGFVIQKHAARRLHYDFRLELDGVLKSWAVTRGPSLDPHDRRLAVRTEDHPLAYADFEGVIPAGEYGGGTVMVWDQGTWEPIDDPHKGMEKGHLHFRLNGKRMHGTWNLVRLNRRDEKRENWLLIKGSDEEARTGEGTILVDEGLTSAVTDRTMDQIAADKDRVWSSNREPKEAKPSATSASAAKPATANKASAAKTSSKLATKTAGRENRARASAKKPPRKSAESDPEGGPRAPLPAFVAPELATLVDRPPVGEDWLHEIKYDGYRIGCRVEDGAATLLTRGGLDWTAKFRPLAEAVARLPADAAFIDGEIVALEPNGLSSFPKLQQALSEGKPESLTYFAFDLLYRDGADLTRLPLEQRKEALRDLLAGLPEDGPIRFSEHYSGRGPDFFTHACRLALEGTVSKRRAAPYLSGRTKDWLKSKCVLRQEFVIGGFLKSSASGRDLRSLSVGYYKDGTLVYAGRVGTGFTAAVNREVFAKLEKLETKAKPFAHVPPPMTRSVTWVKPELVCEVEFTDWTGDGMIRHGSFQGLREDKKPDEIVAEQPQDAQASGDAAPPEPKATKGTTAKVVESRSGGLDMGGVRLTNPDKVLYPEAGLTKRDLAQYYADVALLMLPHVAGRPLSLVRCPEGRGGECFFQRHYGPGLPAAIQRAPVGTGKDAETYVRIDSAAGLIALVQIGVLEIHPWGARADAPDKPDRIVFDFDPDERVPWNRVVEAAQECRERLEALGLTSFVKTTGGKGLHVVVPIARRYSWPEVKAFAKGLADRMAADAPDRYVTNMAKAARKGRIFIDYLRNDATATAVAPYSTRARPNAPVAALLSWDELPSLPSGSAFDLRTLPERLRTQAEDPWAEMLDLNQALTAKARRSVGLKS